MMMSNSVLSQAAVMVGSRLGHASNETEHDAAQSIVDIEQCTTDVRISGDQ